MSFLSPERIREQFGHENVSDELWGLFWGLAFGGSALIAAALFGLWVGTGFWSDLLMLLAGGVGIGMASLAYTMFTQDQLDIPAVPAHAAMLKIWGRRILVVFKEGTIMLFRRWPFNIDAELFDVAPVDFDFPINNIDCGAGIGLNKLAGGSVNGEISGTYRANTDDEVEFARYIDHSGGSAEIDGVLRDVFKEGFGASARQFGWEEFSGLEQQVKALLFEKIGATGFRRLRQPGQPIPLSAWNLTPEQYDRLPEADIVPDLFTYLFREQVDDEERRCRFREAEIFTDVRSADKVSDVKNLGILLTRLNVTIRPVETLQKEADEAAKEDLQRRRELMNDKTKRGRALLHVRASGGRMSYADAIRQVAAEDGIATQVVVATSGNDMLDAAVAHRVLND